MTRSNTAQSYAGASVARTNQVLRNAYLLLAISLLPTIAGTLMGVALPLVAFVPWWMSILVFLAALFGLQKVIIDNRNRPAGIGWLLLFTFVMGYFIGPMVGLVAGMRNGAELILTAIGGTAGIFFILAGYASVTKRDFSSPSLGKMLFIGMMMAFVLSLLNVFLLNMPAVSMAISAVFIVIASGFILFTINRTVRGGETNYIMVTMTLFIMLLNIFQSLLHLLMVFAGNRE